MSTGKIIGLGVLAVIVLAVISGIGSYNSLVEQDEQVVEAWA
ncbi:MAG: LemA family protein, partial [Rhodothermales bacterium]|nr:LemA family protein [Rhodothermales bacterium]